MEKIKILQFPIGNTKSGITQYVLENWRFIDKSKFQFDFATMSSEFSLEEKIRQSGSEVYKIKDYAEDNESSFYKNFRNILEKGNYDIVHLHTSQWKNLTAEKAAKDAGISRIIIHAHNTYVQKKRGNLSIEELYERHKYIRDHLTQDIATDYWACSEAAAEFLYGDKISKNKILIMNNAIDLDKFAFNVELRKNIRNEFNIAENDFLIGHVGRFVYQKNQEFILRVANALKNNGIKFKLMLVGEGSDMLVCQKYVSDNGLNDNVIFTGYRNDVNHLFSAFDLFVLPSRFEGLGIVLVEAQAAGLKCIASSEVPPEAKITDNIEFLPLIEEVWKNSIQEAIHSNYIRLNNNEQITKAGYNIKEQIKVLEKGYLEG